DLYAAGCPSGARLTEYPGWPSKAEAHARLREAVPYLARVRNTGIAWGVRLALRDVYGWEEPISEENWQKLDGSIRERADDRAWHRLVMARAKIRRFGRECGRRVACQG